MKNSTDTSPVHTYYSSYPIYTLKNIPSNRGLQFVYKNPKRDMLWIGLLFVASVLFISFLDEASPMAVIILLSILGGTYFIMKMFQNQMLIFDSKKKLFYRFNKATKEKSDETDLSKIDAIQILHYQEQSTDQDYNSDAYELNLVLKNKRINVITHSDHDAIKEDAQRLGRLLNVPIRNDKAS